MTLLDWMTGELMASVREEDPHPTIEAAFEDALQDCLRSELPPGVPDLEATDPMKRGVGQLLPQLRGEMVGILEGIRHHTPGEEMSDEVAQEVAEGMRDGL